VTFTLGKCRKKLRDPLQVKVQDTVPETRGELKSVTEFVVCVLLFENTPLTIYCRRFLDTDRS
jgi:hypothetical protein